MEEYIRYVESLSKTDWQPLIALHSELKAHKGAFGSWDARGGYFQQGELMKKSLAVVQSLKLVFVFDWSKWEAGKKVFNDASFDLSTLALHELCLTFTYMIRAERFNEGFLHDTFSRGTFLRIITAICQKINA